MYRSVALLLFCLGTASRTRALPIRLAVDAGDTVHKVMHVSESIPLTGQTSLTLLYPEWELASHAPTVSVAELAGLRMMANGKPVEWQRDPINMHAFHVTVPPQARMLDLSFDYLSPVSGGYVSANIVQVEWQHVVLYPQGPDVRAVAIAARLHLPAGFRAASSLDKEGSSAESSVVFRETSLANLVDAPVFAGRYLKEWTLADESGKAITLSAVADAAEDLRLAPSDLTALRQVVEKTNALLGQPPFDHYRFLLSLSSFLPNDGGTEHAQSSEISLPADYFLKPEAYKSRAELFAHEYIHVWNGLAHRPAGMAVKDFNTPMQDSLLWVYEGLTEFWAFHIARDAGQISEQEYRDLLAIDAAQAAERPGRQWKSLADSDNDPIYLAGHRVAWRDWERREDYYFEGPLLWLDVEQQIRATTKGKKTLSDFARSFFAPVARDRPLPYSVNDLTSTLYNIAPTDWKAFFDTRLNAHTAAYVLRGLEAAGYRLTFDDTPSPIFKEQEEGDIDLTYSIGAVVSSSGRVRSVAWNGPAFRAGISPGIKLTRIDGLSFSPESLMIAVKNSVRIPVRLSLSDDENSSIDVTVDYRGGMHYPHLVTTSND